jgi:hypothetical protein
MTQEMEWDWKKEKKQAVRIVVIEAILFIIAIGFIFITRPAISQTDCYKEIMNATGDMDTFWHLNRTGIVYCTVQIGDICECHFLLGNGEVTWVNKTRDILQGMKRERDDGKKG